MRGFAKAPVPRVPPGYVSPHSRMTARLDALETKLDQLLSKLGGAGAGTPSGATGAQEPSSMPDRVTPPEESNQDRDPASERPAWQTGLGLDPEADADAGIDKPWRSP